MSKVMEKFCSSVIMDLILKYPIRVVYNFLELRIAGFTTICSSFNS